MKEFRWQNKIICSKKKKITAYIGSNKIRIYVTPDLTDNICFWRQWQVCPRSHRVKFQLEFKKSALTTHFGAQVFSKRKRKTKKKKENKIYQTLPCLSPCGKMFFYILIEIPLLKYYLHRVPIPLPTPDSDFFLRFILDAKTWTTK